MKYLDVTGLDKFLLGRLNWQVAAPEYRHLDQALTIKAICTGYEDGILILRELSLFSSLRHRVTATRHNSYELMDAIVRQKEKFYDAHFL